MSRPPAGGPATVNGVLYQILWALLRAVKVYTQESSLSQQGDTIERALLILEPLGGGGDVREQKGSRRVVEQLKARADGGTWSLTEVVGDVLPDLYLARDAAFPDTEYRFVTEGRMGRWNAVYRFFQDLKARHKVGNDAIGPLDDAQVLWSPNRSNGSPTEKGPPFWSATAYSEKALFDRIVKSP